MFTGLVEISTTVRSVEEVDASSAGGNGFSITIGDAASILGDCDIGDSIAVDGTSLLVLPEGLEGMTDRIPRPFFFLSGTCLTVTEFSKSEAGGWFKVGLAPETLRRTNLKDLKAGQKVNCERAMAGLARFGGHVVQGHVDTVGQIVGHSRTGNAATITVRLVNDPELPRPAALAPYLIPKGYICVNGVSLTLIHVSPPRGGALTLEQAQLSEEDFAANLTAYPRPPAQEDTIEFSVMLISHSQSVVDMDAFSLGKLANIEFDMTGKFVVRTVQGALATSEGPPQDEEQTMSALERLIEKVVRRIVSDESCKWH